MRRSPRRHRNLWRWDALPTREVGASDYLAKPVDTKQLLSALRMWLRR
jgi:DNA-binding response OmpR family regulator